MFSEATSDFKVRKFHFFGKIVIEICVAFQKNHRRKSLGTYLKKLQIFWPTNILMCQARNLKFKGPIIKLQISQTKAKLDNILNTITPYV